MALRKRTRASFAFRGANWPRFFSLLNRASARVSQSMIRVRVAWAFISAVLFWNAFCASAQVVVYENSAQYSGYYGRSANEYGDELTLAGTARVLTKLQFE